MKKKRNFITNPLSCDCAYGLRPCNTNSVGAGQSWEGHNPHLGLCREPRDSTGGFSKSQSTEGFVRQGHSSKWSDVVECGCSGLKEAVYNGT